MNEQYQKAEDEYFKLRGQFDTGRLTQEQFDEKLRALMVQDAQGRYWMLGADSGKWYYYDGAKWIQGDPTLDASASSANESVQQTKFIPQTPPPATTSTTPVTKVAPVAAPPPPAAPATRKLPIVPILLVVALVILALVGLLLFQNRNNFVASQPPGITPILGATITRAPSPTFVAVIPTVPAATLPPLATAVFTAVPPPASPTQVPSTTPTTAAATATLAATATVPATFTVAPTGTAIPTEVILTSVPETIQPLPTFLPSVTVPPTVAPTLPATAIPATVAPTEIPSATIVPTAVIKCPSEVCVTAISIAPAAPQRNQNVAFTATFLNSTTETRYFHWIVLLCYPEKPCPNTSFGESTQQDIAVNPGETEATISYIAVHGNGACLPLIALAANKVNPQSKEVFPSPNGQPVMQPLTIC